MTILSFEGFWPRISRNCFVAENATVLGDVFLGCESSVWYGAVLRADGERIRIGRRTNVQDNCVLHAHPGHPVIIGDKVSLAHGSLIHGAKVGSNSSIGMGTILLSGSEVGKNCEIGAGLVLFKNIKIPDNTLLIGSFSNTVKKVDAPRAKMLSSFATEHYQLSKRLYSRRLDRRVSKLPLAKVGRK
ncbi:MAG: gamma carbonic anhydrase family protein [Nitrososphaerota archaeon]|nr:gamma carbonic anhydrase family protein [Nitrososphaerota archaeon]